MLKTRDFRDRELFRTLLGRLEEKVASLEGAVIRMAAALGEPDPFGN